MILSLRMAQDRMGRLTYEPGSDTWKPAGSSHVNLDGHDPDRDEERRMEHGMDKRRYASETGDMAFVR